MGKLSLSAKIVGIVAAAVVVVGATLTVCTWYFLNSSYNEESRTEIARTAGLVQSRVIAEEQRLATAAQMTAARKELAEAI